MNDTLFLHQLKVQTIIGVFPHERCKTQTLIIDIELTTDFSAAAVSDEMSDGISYAEIADSITLFAKDAQYKLLERFGHELCQALFKQFPVNSITLSITKPGAIPQTREVGVRMQRQRAQSA